MQKSQLQAEIKAGFDNVAFPGNESLADPNTRDDGEAVVELFHDQDWRVLKSSELWPQAIYWMTPHAIHYFLPAYLLASMEEDSGDVIDCVISFLTPRLDSLPTEKNKFDAFVRLLTPTQIKVICDFIVFVLEDLSSYGKDDAKEEESNFRSLLSYWSQL